jgi:hypothetical protein
MMTLHTVDPRLVALMPGYREAVRAVQEEEHGRRAVLIEKVGEQREALARSDARLSTAAAALTGKAEALRAQLIDIESQIEANAAARRTASHAAESAIKDLQTQLRDEVAESVRNLKLSIEMTRQVIHQNLDDCRSRVLSGDANTNGRIVAALALLLEASREVDRIAVEAADADTALDVLVTRLRDAGITLIAVSGSLQ